MGLLEIAAIAVDVHPNPSTDWIHLEFGDPDTDVTIELLDLSGRSLRVWKGVEGENTHLDVSAMPSGYYVLLVKDARIRMTAIPVSIQ